MKVPEILEQHREYLASSYRPTNEISLSLEKTKPWESKLGGNLYLEDTKTYPKDQDGKPLIFFAQINFGEMPPLPDFPTTGILQFFVDERQDGVSLLNYIPKYSKDETKLATENPYGLDEDYQDLEPFEQPGKITFTQKIMPITTSAGNFDENFHGKVSDEVWDALFEFCYDTGCRVGGYPYFVQNMIASYEDGFDILLLQLDLDDVCDIRFGDAGACNFFVTKEALLNRDFSNPVYDWQCC